MKVREVDERKVGWELPARTFFVYRYTSGEGSTGSVVYTYELTHCTFLEAVRWAQKATQPGESYSVALVDDSRRPGVTGLVWLLGTDPNSEPVDEVTKNLAAWRTDQNEIRF